MLEGSCRLAVDGQPDLTLEAGDFVLLPATPAFTMSGFEPVTPTLIDPERDARAAADEVRHGRRDGDARRAPARRLLRLRLARRGAAGVAAARRSSTCATPSGLATLVAARRRRGDRAAAGPRARAHAPRRGAAGRGAAGDAARRRPAGPAARAGRRAAGAGAARAARPGRALLDRDAARPRRRAVALGVLRALHAHRRRAADGVPAGLAHGAGQGPAPRRELALAEIAERIGYGSASSFSTAFSRDVGVPPSRYAGRRPERPAPAGHPSTGSWSTA